jgi:hypothetical protein
VVKSVLRNAVHQDAPRANVVKKAPKSVITFEAKNAESEITDYKTLRIREMAAEWKGTALEPHTVRLLAMLLVENGALSESTRGDSGYAIGLEQNHICRRGFTAPDFPWKSYCGANAEARLRKDLKGTQFEHYLDDWRTQFKHYTVTVEGMVKDGYSADAVVKSWNPREVGRLNKVTSRESLVKHALDL